MLTVFACAVWPSSLNTDVKALQVEKYGSKKMDSFDIADIMFRRLGSQWNSN